MSREKTRRIERLESCIGGDAAPTNVISGHCFTNEEFDRICTDWRDVVAAGVCVAEDGTRYRARVNGATLWLMPEPLSVGEWLASVRPAA